MQYSHSSVDVSTDWELWRLSALRVNGLARRGSQHLRDPGKETFFFFPTVASINILISKKGAKAAQVSFWFVFKVKKEEVDTEGGWARSREQFLTATMIWQVAQKHCHLLLIPPPKCGYCQTSSSHRLLLLWNELGHCCSLTSPAGSSSRTRWALWGEKGSCSFEKWD